MLPRWDLWLIAITHRECTHTSRSETTDCAGEGSSLFATIIKGECSWASDIIGHTIVSQFDGASIFGLRD